MRIQKRTQKKIEKDNDNVCVYIHTDIYMLVRKKGNKTIDGIKKKSIVMIYICREKIQHIITT